MITRSRTLVVTLIILAIAAAILFAMGRPAICTCGEIALWEPSAASAKTSQMLADWYSPSHLVHGFLFYGLLWLAARHRPIDLRFLVALIMETGWEIRNSR